MPIALQAGAQALGVTTAEFSKLLETGQIVAQDFLPKFAAAIDTMLAGSVEEAANRLDASAQRMGNAWDKLKKTVGDSGVSQAIGTGMTAASHDMNAFSEAMDRAKERGNGFFGQINQGLGVMIGRAVGLNYLTRERAPTSRCLGRSAGNRRRVQRPKAVLGGSCRRQCHLRAEWEKPGKEIVEADGAQLFGGVGLQRSCRPAFPRSPDVPVRAVPERTAPAMHR
jgi:hypothetical protein